MMSKQFKEKSGSKGEKRPGRRSHIDSFKKEQERYEKDLIRFFGENYVNLILSKDKGNYNNYIDNVEKYIKEKTSSISSSQLRNIFSRVKKAQSPEDLWILRPKLAYVAGRDTGSNKSEIEIKELVYLLDKLIQNVDSESKVEQFVDFFEAIIAYHKYYYRSAS